MNIQISPTVKTVLIVGLPATGKTKLAESLKSTYPDFSLIRTDDYIHFGFKESLKYIIDHIESYPKRCIIEGVQGYRLLKNGFKPDLIIHCTCDKLKRLERRQFKLSTSFDSLLINWWKDYIKISERTTPIIEYNTTEL